MEPEILEGLVRWLEEEVGHLERNLGQGVAPDYPTYQNMVGQVWAMRRALDTYKEISDKFLEDG